MFVNAKQTSKGNELWQIDGRGPFVTVGNASRILSSRVPLMRGPASALDRHRNVVGFEIRRGGEVVQAVAMSSGWATMSDWQHGDRLLSSCGAASVAR